MDQQVSSSSPQPQNEQKVNQNNPNINQMQQQNIDIDQICIKKHQKRQIRCGIREGCQDINNFNRLNRIHQGVYGVVYRAQDMKTKEVVAIKKLKLSEGTDFPITSLRQITILKSIKHENIIKIIKVSGNHQRDRVFIVMQYMDHQLKALLKNNVSFNQEHIRRLMKDLLLGVDYLHQRNILHRDLKTSNLLYSNQGILKICDFGLARRISQKMTLQVVSLPYRAPQLLIGSQQYSTQIDIWSIGCIFAELALGDTLFQGKTQLQQLDSIFKIIGSPTNQSWPNFKQYKNGMYVVGNKYTQNKLRSIISRDKLSDIGLDLLMKLLVCYPKKRISAEKALKHDWFKGVIAERPEMPTFVPINEMDRVKKLVKS